MALRVQTLVTEIIYDIKISIFCRLLNVGTICVGSWMTIGDVNVEFACIQLATIATSTVIVRWSDALMKEYK